MKPKPETRAKAGRPLVEDKRSKTVHVRIGEETHATLAGAAKSDGRAVSNLIGKILDDWAAAR